MPIEIKIIKENIHNIPMGTATVSTQAALEMISLGQAIQVESLSNPLPQTQDPLPTIIVQTQESNKPTRIKRKTGPMKSTKFSNSKIKKS